MVVPFKNYFKMIGIIGIVLLTLPVFGRVLERALCLMNLLLRRNNIVSVQAVDLIFMLAQICEGVVGVCLDIYCGRVLVDIRVATSYIWVSMSFCAHHGCSYLSYYSLRVWSWPFSSDLSP